MTQLRFLLPILILLSIQAIAQQTVGLFQNDSLAYDGYTLFSSRVYFNTYLLDNCGRVVHSWPNTEEPGISSYLLENGNLLRTSRTPSGVFSGGGIGGVIELYDWDNNLLWSYRYISNQYHQHHDIEPLPNGNILLLAWEYRHQTEVAAAGRDPYYGEMDLWPTQVVEITPLGTDSATIVWEWHLWDHLVQDYDSTKENFGVVADHPELVDINYVANGSSDWIHANSVDYNEALDQIIINSRTFSEFWIIDHSTTTAESAGHSGGNMGKGGDILYRWGNPRIYGRGTASDQQLFGAHDAHWIPIGRPDAGKIMVFNNGYERTPLYSNIEVIVPPVDLDGNYLLAPNAAFGPPAPFWEYPETPNTDFYSSNLSGAQRLPNGNTLICEGASGHFFEVDAAGTILWDYVNPISFTGPVAQGNTPLNNTVFRTERFSSDYAAFIGRDLMPGEPLELYPYPSACKTYTGVEEFNQLQAGISLPTLIYSDEIPVSSTLGKPLQVEVVDVMGRLWHAATFERQQFFIPIGKLPVGVYFIRFSNRKNGASFIKKVVRGA